MKEVKSIGLKSKQRKKQKSSDPRSREMRIKKKKDFDPTSSKSKKKKEKDNKQAAKIIKPSNEPGRGINQSNHNGRKTGKGKVKNQAHAARQGFEGRGVAGKHLPGLLHGNNCWQGIPVASNNLDLGES